MLVLALLCMVLLMADKNKEEGRVVPVLLLLTPGALLGLEVALVAIPEPIPEPIPEAPPPTPAIVHVDIRLAMAT
jgi:hypothetical protein